MKRVRRNEHRISLLLNLTRSISSVNHVDELLDAIVRSIVQGLSVKGVLVRLPDEKTGILKVRANYGISREYLKENPLNWIERN